MPPVEIFDRSARRRAFYASQRAEAGDRWLLARMADEILFRLDAVKRSFARTLIIGSYAADISGILDQRGMSGAIASIRPVDAPWPFIICDEDRMAIKDQSFDLVLAAGGLDSVNDLPGALILIRRILTPGGLFMGAMAGAGSLLSLKPVLTGDGAILRSHPQIDVRAAGDLLSRAGFALPVADADIVDTRYTSLPRLFADIRANALGNCLTNRIPLCRADMTKIQDRFEAALATDGRFCEQFNLIYLTGWAPDF